MVTDALFGYDTDPYINNLCEPKPLIVYSSDQTLVQTGLPIPPESYVIAGVCPNWSDPTAPTQDWAMKTVAAKIVTPTTTVLFPSETDE